MKIWFNLFIVFLYSASIFQPVLPVYDYFLNYDYIVNVLCVNKDKPEMHCDGKCYLKKELSQSSKLKNNSKKALNNYRFKPVPVYFEIIEDFKTNLFNEKLNRKIFSKENSFDNFIFKPKLPPPRL